MLAALHKFGVSPQQWHGYGEFEYSGVDGLTVNNGTAVTPELGARLLDLAKQNRPHWQTSLVFNAAFNPLTQSIKKEFMGNAGNTTMGALDFGDVTAACLRSQSADRLQFAGLRDVFMVWQRFNRCHGKPFYCNPAATGETPEDPVQLFLDDNAYEEAGVGRPGPYIVTVHHRTSGGQYLAAPTDAVHREVVRPDKEQAYTNPNYYEQLLRAAAIPTPAAL